jgi:hypothetical protein
MDDGNVQLRPTPSSVTAVLFLLLLLSEGSGHCDKEGVAGQLS